MCIRDSYDPVGRLRVYYPNLMTLEMAQRGERQEDFSLQLDQEQLSGPALFAGILAFGDGNILAQGLI